MGSGRRAGKKGVSLSRRVARCFVVTADGTNRFRFAPGRATCEPSHMSHDTDDEVPEIPIVCSECGTRTHIPFPDVEDAVARHNENIHDGESIAQVDPDVMDQLADMVAQDLGLLEE
jgi:hypothetical protein